MTSRRRRSTTEAIEITRGVCKGCGRLLIVEYNASTRKGVSRHEAPLCAEFERRLAQCKTAKRLPDTYVEIDGVQVKS